MSGAPKTARTLLPLPGERALLGEEPFGLPPQTITHPHVPTTRCRRDRTGRHGRDGLPGTAGAWPIRCRPIRPPSPPRSRTRPAMRAFRWPICSQRSSDPPGIQAEAQPVSYTVRSGDSLSSIAGRFYHKQRRLAGPLLGQPQQDPLGEHRQRRAGPADPGRARQDTRRTRAARAGRTGAGRTGRRTGRDGQPGVRTRAGRSPGQQLLGRHARRLVRAVRDSPRVWRECTGHELLRPLRPVPVQRGDLGRVWRIRRRLRPRQRGRAEPGVLQRDGPGRTVQLVRPTTAADPHQHTTARGERKSPRRRSVCTSGLPRSGDCARVRA